MAEMRYVYVPTTSEEPAEDYHEWICRCGYNNTVLDYSGESHVACDACGGSAQVAEIEAIELEEAA